MSNGFLDKDKKEEILKEQKVAAIEKIASFNQTTQDPYPSPFLNLSDMQLPESTVEIFKWCKYYYTFDPLISGAINALATFPVTEIHLEDKDGDSRKERSDTAKLYEKVLFKNLNIYKLLIEIGIDYFLYGNCFVMGELKGKEKGDQEWSNIIRLDPSKMMIDYNPATGEKKYRWQVPQKIREICTKKAPRAEYDKIPAIIKEAVRKNQTIVLNPENVYHFSRATDSLGENSVWGVPAVANVLKLLMYRNILRQAQEAIAREHIVPMRIYYLDRTQSVNVQADWNKVANDLAGEIKKSVRDPNHKVVSPVPVNVINVGGEGRGLLLAPEIEQIQTEILAGMNVPREFIFGGVSYSGSSISLRILENQFITYRLLLEDFIQNFVIRKMAKARGEWLSEDDDESLVTVKLADLKMQDDVQQKQLIIQLNSAGKCSNDYMWKSMGMEPEKMKEAIEKEAIDAVRLKNKVEQEQMKHQLDSMEMQMQIQMAQLKMQMQLQLAQQQMQSQMQPQMPQQMPGQEGEQQGQIPQQGDEQQGQAPQQEAGEQGPQPAEQSASNVDEEMEREIQNVALNLMKLSDKDRAAYMEKVPIQVKDRVLQKIEELKGSQQQQEAVDMRPLPQQKPPRRKSLN